jgi:hypothetical protein
MYHLDNKNNYISAITRWEYIIYIYIYIYIYIHTLVLITINNSISEKYNYKIWLRETYRTTLKRHWIYCTTSLHSWFIKAMEYASKDWGSIPQRNTIFLSSATSRAALCLSQPPIICVPWCKAGHSFPSKEQDKNTWNFDSTPQYAPISRYLDTSTALALRLKQNYLCDIVLIAWGLQKTWYHETLPKGL